MSFGSNFLYDSLFTLPIGKKNKKKKNKKLIFNSIIYRVFTTVSILITAIAWNTSLTQFLNNELDSTTIINNWLFTIIVTAITIIGIYNFQINDNILTI